MELFVPEMNEAVCFTTSNNSFGPTEISYLENRFCNMALKAKQYTVKNAVDPTPGNITEEKQSELDDFIEYAKIVMAAFQHNVFEPATGDPEEAKNSTVLHLKHTLKTLGKVEADGMQTAEGFAVLAGSHISPEDGYTIPSTVKESRRVAKEIGKIDDNWILKEDLSFTSPSYAAMFVIGKSANGLTSWKTAEGKTLKQVEDEAAVASEE